MAANQISIDFNTEGFRAFAAELDVVGADFAKAARKAVATTLRTLNRLGLSKLAKTIGAPNSGLKHRVNSRNWGSSGHVWFGIDPLSLSYLKDSTARKVPGAFQIKKFGADGAHPWFTRKSPSYPFIGKGAGLGGLQKIFRDIAAEGRPIANELRAMANELLEKNMHREINQVLRKRQYAKT